MKENYKFKVGDRVQFKTWEEMVEEFGLKEDGLESDFIDCTCAFINYMKHLCGTYATIKDIVNPFDGVVILKDFTSKGDTYWNYSLDMLKPAKPAEINKEFDEAIKSMSEKQFNKCMKCKHFDDSDSPNLFCNLSCEGLNDGCYRYCPKNPESVIALVEKLDYTIQELQKENSRLKIQLEMKDKEGK